MFEKKQPLLVEIGGRSLSKLWLVLAFLSGATLALVLATRAPQREGELATDSTPAAIESAAIATTSAPSAETPEATASPEPVAVETTPAVDTTTAASTAPSSGSASAEAATPPVETPRPLAQLVDGSYTQESQAFVYDSDALILLNNGSLLSSPRGVMVSDEKQTIFVGDLTLQTAQNTILADEAVLNAQEGRMTAKNVTIDFAKPEEPKK